MASWFLIQFQNQSLNPLCINWVVQQQQEKILKGFFFLIAP